MAEKKIKKSIRCGLAEYYRYLFNVHSTHRDDPRPAEIDPSGAGLAF
jgi:hypothetical protein